MIWQERLYQKRTGNKSTNDGTGQRYEKVFHQDEMKNEKRIISHARNNSNIDTVLGKDGGKYSVKEALDKKIDWIQIDIGFLSEQEKDTILNLCKYAVVNGSHTVMGEIMGGKSKPIIGIPIYDEHTNNIRWAEEKNLGVLAIKTSQVTKGISKIKENYEEFQDSLNEFSKNFVPEWSRKFSKNCCSNIRRKEIIDYFDDFFLIWHAGFRWANGPQGMMKKSACRIISINRDCGNAFMEKIKPNQ